jgi:hypothetical protein
MDPIFQNTTEGTFQLRKSVTRERKSSDLRDRLQDLSVRTHWVQDPIGDQLEFWKTPERAETQRKQTTLENDIALESGLSENLYSGGEHNVRR